MPKKKQSFESALNRLEVVINTMEQDQTELEQVFSLYKEGIELTKYCMENLNTMEKEITVLQQTAEGVFIQKPLDGEAEPVD
jgi:exodeoxyribonuclease VII small subunit